jgi:hypothetical protein
MKNLFKITSVLVLILFFTACKKYEDGPLISFRSKQHRLEGKWKLTSLMRQNEELGVWVNGANYAGFLCLGVWKTFYSQKKIESSNWEFTNDKIVINDLVKYLTLDEKATGQKCEAVYETEEQRTNNDNGTWKFDEKKENITITTKYWELELKILELREKKLKLKHTANGATTTYTFETLD